MKRVLLTTILLLLLFGMGYGWATFQYQLFPELDAQLTLLEKYHPPTVCHLYDRHGQPFDTLYSERRFWVPLSEISVAMQKAVVAAEDRRFYAHRGFDPEGIMRAYSANREAGAPVQGGSTLTQQLVKHLVVGSERSLARKAREALLAWRLEQTMSKDEILELYLNFIYLGAGNYGVEAAARDYFNKSAASLSVSDAAVIAGLIPAPSSYSPRRDPDIAAKRRDHVLKVMVETGDLSAIEANQLHYANIFPPPRKEDDNLRASAYRTEVRKEIAKHLGDQLLFEHGLQVHTPYDPAIQAIAEEALAKAADDIASRQGNAGPVDHLEHDNWELFFLQASGLKRDYPSGEVAKPSAGECFPAAFVHDRAAFMVAGPLKLPLSAAAKRTHIRATEPDEPSKTLIEAARAGQVYRVCMNDEGKLDLEDRRWVQGAAIVIDNRNGGVVAMVGGLDMALAGFNRVTQATRQPGSAFKPVVYAAALESGKTQLDRILDAPLVLRSGGARWQPHNYDGRYRGRVTLRQALTHSLNTATVRLGLEVGLDHVLAMARRLGIHSFSDGIASHSPSSLDPTLPLDRDPTLPLGSKEVSLSELAYAYAAIARGGLDAEPVYIDHLVDRNGHEVGRAGEGVTLPGEPWRGLPGGPGKRVISAATASQLIDMLKEVIHRGTGRKAYRPGFERAGKTGTSSDYADAWFIGMIPDYTVGVWIGCDQRVPLGLGESGGRAALPVFCSIVDALEGDTPRSFPLPDDVVKVRRGGEIVVLPKSPGKMSQPGSR